MSVHIVAPPQRRPRPTYAASGGNGGWARRPPGLAAAAPEARYRGPGSAATRRELSRAIIAVLKYRYGTCGLITHAQPHGSCWALPSSVWRRLHGPVRALRTTECQDNYSVTCTLCVLASLPQPDLEVRSLRNAARQ